MFTNSFVKRSYIQFDYRLVWNDVLLGASLKRSHCQDSRVGSCNLTRNNRLQPKDGDCGHYHGIDTRLGHGAVGTSTKQTNLKAIACRRDDTLPRAKETGRTDHHVLCENDIRLGKTLEQAIIDHCPRTLACFFCGLKHKQNCATP